MMRSGGSTVIEKGSVRYIGEINLTVYIIANEYNNTTTKKQKA